MSIDQSRSGLKITPVIKGGYQLSSQYLNQYDRDISDHIIEDMFAAADAGIKTFDCGDIYIGVEEKIGEFIEERKRRLGHADDITVLTKFVPDLQDLHKIDMAYTEETIDRSRRRLKLDCLDMVQFHWWDYEIDGCLKVLGYLNTLREKGKIAHIGLTNFGTEYTKKILDTGIPVATTQIQYSILDQRPGKTLAALCAQHQVGLICYGTLSGSFLTERWIGKSAPERPYREKYSRIIDDVASWDKLQDLLSALKIIADRHDVSVASVASRYVLEQPAVKGVIVGAHDAEQIKEARDVMKFSLNSEDKEQIAGVLSSFHPLKGDVFELERDMSGKHGEIYLSRRDRHSESGSSM